MADGSDNAVKKLPSDKAAHLGPYRFKPGQSGNPLGCISEQRKELRRLIATTFGPRALNEIARMATEARSEKVRLDANIWIAEQAIGKAAQPVTGENGEPIKLDVMSLVKTLRKIGGEDEE